MTHKELELVNVSRAKRGSKQGWPTATTQLPPETFDKLERLRLRRGKNRGDILAEAVTYFLAHVAA